jgi:hypothetical protein
MIKNTNIYRYHADPESLDLFREVTAKNPQFKFQCALTLGRRWPEIETEIAKDSYFAYVYAKDVIKERFPEGEAAIAKDAGHAYFYAKHVIKGRWPEGEAAIAKNRVVKPVYEKLFNVKLS